MATRINHHLCRVTEVLRIIGPKHVVACIAQLFLSKATHCRKGGTAVCLQTLQALLWHPPHGFSWGQKIRRRMYNKQSSSTRSTPPSLASPLLTDPSWLLRRSIQHSSYSSVVLGKDNLTRIFKKGVISSAETASKIRNPSCMKHWY